MTYIALPIRINNQQIHLFCICVYLNNFVYFFLVDDSTTDLVPNGYQSEEDLVKPVLPELPSLFHVGQLVICVVISVDVQRRHIELSLNPKLVNAHVTGKTVQHNMVSICKNTFSVCLYVL